MAVDVDDDVVAGPDELHAGDHVVDLPVVVVPRADVHHVVGAGEALVGQVEPLLDALVGEVMEQLVDLGGVGAIVVELLARLMHPVVAGVLDDLLGLRQLLLGLDVEVVAHQGGLPAPARLLDQRDEHLAEQVAVEDGHIDTVDGQRVEELAEADHRAVDVGDVEELDHALTPSRRVWGGGLPAAAPHNTTN